MVTRSLCTALVLTLLASALSLPTPSPQQLQYQESEIVGLTHFNMATFVRNGDPACNKDNWNTGVTCSNVSVFNPEKLNVSNWLESYQAVGAQSAVLTAKHGCGFVLFDTNATLPDGSRYRYAVNRDGGFPRDVVREFSDTLRAAGLRTGYYYSTGNNFYLNRINFKQAGPLLPGQGNVTDDQFNDIVVAQLTELWSSYGSLGEIWFDHGYGAGIQTRVEALLQKYQPNAVGFNGFGIMNSPVRWCGTESGKPVYPMWSTGCSSDGPGDPTSTDWCAPGDDTTLQEGDTWFFVPGTGVRSLQELIPIYHDTVGANGVLELDFAINRDGLVEPSHAQRYAEFGNWIRSCYGSPIASLSNTTFDSSVTLSVLSGAPQFDRAMIQENLQHGQRIRTYSIEYSSDGSTWTSFGTGSSVGNKRIHLGSNPVSASHVRLNFTAAAYPVYLRNFAVFEPCPTQ
eukprot:m.148285 g.148285  ORF g.148285 m.148285 type:complete len:456 (+) comp24385_c1_seq5:15-1382(+)